MDLEVQIRPHSSRSRPPAHRPLSLDQRLAQGDRFRKAKERLEVSLQEIQQAHSSPSSAFPSHTGQDDCERCARRKGDIARAYYAYYLDSDPESWVSYATPEYRRELERRFNDPGSSLDDLHATFRMGLREYLKLNLSSGTVFSEDELSSLFIDERSTTEILNTCLEQAQQKTSNSDTATFIAELQGAKGPEDRAQVYAKYYCSQSWADSSSVKNFKAKYARMFEQLVPHDEVVAAMRREAEESQSSRLAGLSRQLSELEMAQSAHLKAKARKDQKMRDREPSPGVVQCSLVGCANEVDLATDETIECAVCEWLERKGSEKGRAFYCCMGHAEEDFEEHDRNDHQCCMGGGCFYFPQAGPPGETGNGGICQDCADEEFTSYFCSQDCYHHNLELHREDFHMGKGIHNDSDNLEMFRPADDMEIMS
ncbi:uncharacterized protein LY89DRAFT_680347 [Mollisia scopiformis]|uniref:Uncharacterized protein n=1 Tax=Mollisia scopiformis TaxID=149040 RepID=A0A194XV89_MOLSC|nr:uncharacterized protein LY89DRAFT_680347 [Mollisia scopiformis]KUJ23627.1 hypothetical protein LY89DRAFT_680347 [Mollisia scopiformis]